MKTNAPTPMAPAIHGPTVATNGPTGGEGLRAVVDPWAIVPLWQWIAGIAVALLVLGLAATALILWWRARQRRRHAPPPAAPPLPPHVRAHRELEAALGLLSEPDRFCTEVSRILRQYLEERFGWNAPDRTTEEFLRELQGASELDADQQVLLADFLTRCDLVKFARHDPTETELRDLHRAAVRFVVETIPPVVSPGAAPAVAGIPETAASQR